MRFQYFCFASTCTAPHFVLERKQLEDGRTLWIVSAKTFFDIVMCYVRTKENHCNCHLASNGKQCYWCQSISQILLAASHFSHQNAIGKEIATNFILEFAKKLPCYDCHICAKNKIVLGFALKNKKIVNEKEREQYLSDYVFD